MAKNKNVYEQITKAGREGVDNLNRLDEASRKFRRSGRRSSIIKASQGNVFEFPVFVSSSIPLDYAIASNALLEQIYASYLQFAISVNPIQNVDAVKKQRMFSGIYSLHTRTMKFNLKTNLKQDNKKRIFHKRKVLFTEKI